MSASGTPSPGPSSGPSQAPRARRTAPDPSGRHLGALALGTAAAALLPWLASDQLVIAITLLLFAGWAAAWDLLGGWTGQVSLGHAAFVGVGAYAVGLGAQRFELAPWWSLPLGMAAAALLALGWGALTFKLRGSYFVLSSIAIAEILRLVAINERWLTGGAQGLFIPDLPPLFGRFDPFALTTLFYAALAFFALVTLTVILVARDRLGYHMRAVREDEEAAQAAGVDPLRVKLVAFALSGAFTALGGGIHALKLSFLEPHDIFFLPLSVQIALTAIIGGRGTVWGPLAGAALLIVGREVFRQAFAEANLLIYGALILLVVLFAPRGLIGELTRRLVRRRYARSAGS